MLLELHKSLQQQCLNAQCIMQYKNAIDRHISCTVVCWHAYQLCKSVNRIQPNVAICDGSANPLCSVLQFICVNPAVCINCQSDSGGHCCCSAGDEVLVGTLDEEELLQLNVQQLEYR